MTPIQIIRYGDTATTTGEWTTGSDYWYSLIDSTSSVTSNFKINGPDYGSYINESNWQSAFDISNDGYKQIVKQYENNGTQYTIQWQVDVQPPSRRSRLRSIIRERLSPAIITTRKSLSQPTDPRELRAREALKSIVGEELFQRFLRHGFVSVHNRKSGRTYQIFTGHRETQVWENGKKTCSLCVILPHDFAPTDSVIVRYFLALNNEQRLWQLANRHNPRTAPVSKYRSLLTVESRPLVDIFNTMKKAG